MIKPAILYKEELPKLYQSVWFNDKYKYYNYNSYWSTYPIEDKTWEWHEFVSVDENNTVIGYIHYRVDRVTMNCMNFGAINFFDSNAIFGRDLLQVITDIFEKFNFHKFTFSVVIGNPIEKTYDKLCQKYGGRIIGIEKEETKLQDNKYYDVKRYEILHSEYIASKEKR